MLKRALEEWRRQQQRDVEEKKRLLHHHYHACNDVITSNDTIMEPSVAEAHEQHHVNEDPNEHMHHVNEDPNQHLKDVPAAHDTLTLASAMQKDDETVLSSSSSSKDVVAALEAQLRAEQTLSREKVFYI